jgi:hypothetical protein
MYLLESSEHQSVLDYLLSHLDDRASGSQTFVSRSIDVGTSESASPGLEIMTFKCLVNSVTLLRVICRIICVAAPGYDKNRQLSERESRPSLKLKSAGADTVTEVDIFVT